MVVKRLLYIDGVILVILDITERKLVEDALFENEEKLAGILASVTDHISNSNYENCPYFTGKYGMFALWLQRLTGLFNPLK